MLFSGKIPLAVTDNQALLYGGFALVETNAF
jgi:hypothetical protein